MSSPQALLATECDTKQPQQELLRERELTQLSEKCLRTTINCASFERSSPCYYYYEGLETRRGHHPRDDWTLVVFSVEAVSALNMTRLRGLGLGATPCRLVGLMHACLRPSQPIFRPVGACEVMV